MSRVNVNGQDIALTQGNDTGRETVVFARTAEGNLRGDGHVSTITNFNADHDKLDFSAFLGSGARVDPNWASSVTFGANHVGLLEGAAHVSGPDQNIFFGSAQAKGGKDVIISQIDTDPGIGVHNVYEVYYLSANDGLVTTKLVGILDQANMVGFDNDNLV